MEDNNPVQTQPTVSIHSTVPVEPQLPIAPPQPEQSQTTISPSGFPIKLVLLFTVLILLIIIAVITGGMYYLGKTKAKLTPSPMPITSVKSTPTPNPTASWKTYTNTKLGYSVKYPSDFKLDTTSDIAPCKNLIDCSTADLVSFESAEKFGDVEPLRYGFGVNYLNNTSHQDLKTLITKDLPPDIQNSFVLTQSIINKMTIYRTTSIPGNGDEHVYFKNPNNDSYIELVYGPTPVAENPLPSQDKYYSIFNQILSTLKFTDQTSPSATCKPRPTCLDATPRCLIPETSDMCPPTITPSP